MQSGRFDALNILPQQVKRKLVIPGFKITPVNDQVDELKATVFGLLNLGGDPVFQIVFGQGGGTGKNRPTPPEKDGTGDQN